LIDRMLAGATSRRVLDLGCGDGHHARQLAKQSYDVVAIDASEPVIEHAKDEPGNENVEFLLGDMGAVERMIRGHFGAALCQRSSTSPNERRDKKSPRSRRTPSSSRRIRAR